MTHAVEARQLVFRYSARTALADSSFQMESGNVIALIGPNGSGKSTLLDAIAALHTPAAGDLEVLGGPPRRARRELAYALQATKVN
jgi:ABC-type multidrug transport system ATPase subunit